MSIVSPSLDVSEEDGQRNITTLATLKNSSSGCLQSVVIEAKYFDDRGLMIDTVTQPIYGIVVMPNQEVAFRIRDAAARPKSFYSTQALRVVSADAGSARNSRSLPISKSIIDFLASWGPALLLIAVWTYLVHRMKQKDSPQGRTIALFEQQNALLDTQNHLLSSIAASLKQGNS
ncbi:hypothetical protein [Rhizobacter sp. Root404]|uniref:hypothetical protein n=1 Tax=Rhizobacter sp. Root404 TaxID=1736528 RepID=UPI0012F880AF|nr:hypothetical protein [Rhizobacter sp. Root404]